jgi:hypothetical protein
MTPDSTSPSPRPAPAFTIAGRYGYFLHRKKSLRHRRWKHGKGRMCSSFTGLSADVGNRFVQEKMITFWIIGRYHLAGDWNIEREYSLTTPRLRQAQVTSHALTARGLSQGACTYRARQRDGEKEQSRDGRVIMRA